MFLRLLALFTLVPVIELFLLVEVGQRMGLVPTLALVLFTGALGAALARSQGLRVLRQVQADMARGALPAEALMEGLMVFIAGAVLLTPGLLTDVAGFFLLIPGGRRLVRKWLSRRLKGRFHTVGPDGRVRRHGVPPGYAGPTDFGSAAPNGGPGGDGPRRPTPQQVIVVDHRPVDDKPSASDRQLSD